MRIPQLTLYDFLADFIPGAIALAVLGILCWLLGYAVPGLTASTGVILVVASYPVGRTFHAIAGQAEVRALRESTFDAFVYALEEVRRETGQIPRDIAVTSKPSASDRLGPNKRTETDPDETQFNDWIDGELRAALTGWDSAASSERRPTLRASDDAIFSATEIDWTDISFGQLQRFAYSELFDESTLYQRYNILETFYRNLWLVSSYFGLIFTVVAFAILIPSLPKGVLGLDLALVLVLFCLGYKTEDVLGALVMTMLAISYFATPFVLPSSPRSVLSATVLLSWVAAITLVAIAIADSSTDECECNSDKRELSAAPPWYWLALFVGASIVIAVPVGFLLLGSSLQPMNRPSTFLAGALVLFALAMLFDIRRLQFKRRQERALINDLYLAYQRDTDDE